MNAYQRAVGLLSFVPLFSAVLALGQASNEQTKFAETASTTATLSVTDRDHRPVTGLNAENFTLYLDGQRQTISSVASGDVPACVAILVDKSGSMRRQLPAIASAMGAFVAAGNPGSKTFVVTFNDDPVLEQDFTSDPAVIESVLVQVDARGGTAFYDSLIATADHLAEAGGCNKRVLLAVSDGEDNESRKSLEYTLTALQHDWNPLVYAIGLPSNKPGSRSHRVLETLTSNSGGLAIFVNDLGDVRKAALKIGDVIKNQYVVTYAPSQPVGSGDRAMKAELRAAGHKDLTVRLNMATKVDRPAPAVAGTTPGSSCVSGIVIDENDKPVAGINVVAWPTFSPNSYAKDSYPSTVSDEHGKFKIEQLEKGLYQLYTDKESAGYAPTRNSFYRYATLPLIQVSEKCAKVAVRVGPKAARLRIHVVDAGTGTPLPRFGISFRDRSGVLVVSQASQGQEVMVPANTDLTISAWSYGYPRSQPSSVTSPGPEAAQDVTIQLSPRAAASAGSDH
ncbi:MAG TPA: VWA domain-containing protein [Candidatus Angelobacter sp.]|jgi:VWFA-related protein